MRWTPAQLVIPVRAPQCGPRPWRQRFGTVSCRGVEEGRALLSQCEVLESGLPHARYGLDSNDKNRERKMSEISAAARALAIILAIVSAFVSVPLIPPLLLIFGGIAAIK